MQFRSHDGSIPADVVDDCSRSFNAPHRLGRWACSGPAAGGERYCRSRAAVARIVVHGESSKNRFAPRSRSAAARTATRGWVAKVRTTRWRNRSQERYSSPEKRRPPKKPERSPARLRPDVAPRNNFLPRLLNRERRAILCGDSIPGEVFDEPYRSFRSFHVCRRFRHTGASHFLRAVHRSRRNSRGSEPAESALRFSRTDGHHLDAGADRRSSRSLLRVSTLTGSHLRLTRCRGTACRFSREWIFRTDQQRNRLRRRTRDSGHLDPDDCEL